MNANKPHVKTYVMIELFIVSDCHSIYFKETVQKDANEFDSVQKTNCNSYSSPLVLARHHRGVLNHNPLEREWKM